MTEVKRPRVLVIDDQLLVRQGIVSLLELADISVCGEASDGAEGFTAIQELDPDVVLLDMRMPRYDGLWLLGQLSAQHEGNSEALVPILLLTTFDDDTQILQALRLGAKGCLLKDVSVDQLAAAVRTLVAGGTLIAPSITDQLMRALRNSPAPNGAAELRATPLSPREVEVLRLVAEGYTNREIAEVLFLAEGTVKNHIGAILAKLGARDRTNAVLRALREGLLG